MVKKFSEFEDARCGLETLTDPSLFLVLGFKVGNDFRVPVSEGGNVHDPSRAAQTSLTLKSFLLRR